MRLLVGLLLLAAGAPALGAQHGTPLTRFGIWNELYEPYVVCHLLHDVPQGLRDQGMVRLFQVAEAGTGRSGTLGLDARGLVRYLLINVTASRTEMGRQVVESEVATVHFNRDGSIEVGRRGVYHWTNDTVPQDQSQVFGLSVPEAERAIALARSFRAICLERLKRR